MENEQILASRKLNCRVRYDNLKQIFINEHYMLNRHAEEYGEPIYSYGAQCKHPDGFGSAINVLSNLFLLSGMKEFFM